MRQSEVRKKVRRPKVRFNESEIKLVLSLMDKLQKPIELMYYLMERENETSFVIILLSGNGIKLEKTVKLGKRDTDLLYTIDKDKNLFALICQETKVDGAYRFAERLLKKLIVNNITQIYCSEIEVRLTKHPVQEVIFKSIENYNKIKKDKKENEIIFYSLS